MLNELADVSGKGIRTRISYLNQKIDLPQMHVVELKQDPPSLSEAEENDECLHECLCEPYACAWASWRSRPRSKEFEIEASVSDWVFRIVTIVSEKNLVSEEIPNESDCCSWRLVQISIDESESEQWTGIVNLLESHGASGCRRIYSLIHLGDVEREDPQRMNFLRPRLAMEVQWRTERH